MRTCLLACGALLLVAAVLGAALLSIIPAASYDVPWAQFEVDNPNFEYLTNVYSLSLARLSSSFGDVSTPIALLPGGSALAATSDFTQLLCQCAAAASVSVYILGALVALVRCCCRRQCSCPCLESAGGAELDDGERALWLSGTALVYLGTCAALSYAAVTYQLAAGQWAAANMQRVTSQASGFQMSHGYYYAMVAAGCALCVGVVAAIAAAVEVCRHCRQAAEVTSPSAAARAAAAAAATRQRLEVEKQPLMTTVAVRPAAHVQVRREPPAAYVPPPVAARPSYVSPPPAPPAAPAQPELPPALAHLAMAAALAHARQRADATAAAIVLAAAALAAADTDSDDAPEAPCRRTTTQPTLQLTVTAVAAATTITTTTWPARTPTPDSTVPSSPGPRHWPATPAQACHVTAAPSGGDVHALHECMCPRQSLRQYMCHMHSPIPAGGGRRWWTRLSFIHPGVLCVIFDSIDTIAQARSEPMVAAAAAEAVAAVRPQRSGARSWSWPRLSPTWRRRVSTAEV